MGEYINPNFPKIFSRIFLSKLCKRDYPPFLCVRMSYMEGGYGESPPYRGYIDPPSPILGG